MVNVLEFLIRFLKNSHCAIVEEVIKKEENSNSGIFELLILETE